MSCSMEDPFIFEVPPWLRCCATQVHLFIDRASYDRGGMERSYASKARKLGPPKWGSQELGDVLFTFGD